eukprot:6214722-Pleurochrysis_carterae.AAC.1
MVVTGACHAEQCRQRNLTITVVVGSSPAPCECTNLGIVDTLSFVTGRVATEWPHFYNIVHPYIDILPDR